MKKGLRVVLFLLSFGGSGMAQYYSTGQDPASIRWRQIKTSGYQLIYPVHFEKKAQYLANILDVVVRNETHTLHARVPCIPIVLHTHSVISNGVTVWAPKRIEMYSCTPQLTYAEEWLEQLAIHEYRHAVQVSKMNRGFTKALYVLFGEQATGGILGLYAPAWFLEGDATVTETALSKTGRGRSAIFEAPLRAQVVEKGIYSFDKATLGSYKTFTPDAYELGYFLVGQVRKEYGAQVWNKPLDRSASLPFMIVPFASGLKTNTGLSKVKLYRQTLAHLDSGWTTQLNSSIHGDLHYITKPDPKNHPVYTHPIYLNDSIILADKSSMDDINRFVLIDLKTGNEKVLLTPGNHISGTTSIAGNFLAWAEQEPDIRWQNRDYAEIKIYDFSTRRIRTLIRKTRYFSPILSPDAKRIAVVYVTPQNKCSIRILEIPSGKLLRDIPMDHYDQAITPNWSPDASKIIFTLLNEKGQTIATADLNTGKLTTHLPFAYDEFNGPSYFYSHYIIFSTDYSGVENLYALDTLSHHIFKITTSRFGARDPDFTTDKKYMIYSDYCADGLMVAGTRIDTAAWIPLGMVNDHSIRLYSVLSLQEKVNIQDSVLQRNLYKINQKDDADLVKDSIRGTIYPTRKYSKFLHLFTPHSWAPASFDINNLTFLPGVMILMQNTLSTAFVSAGWEYDINGQTGKFYANLSLLGLYPAFNFRFDIGNRSAYYENKGSSEMIRFTWQEMNFNANISIPWNLSRGKYSRFLRPSLGTTLVDIVHNTTTPQKFVSGLIQTMDYRLQGSQYLHSNQKDLYPRWGQSFDMIYRNSPFSKNDMGSIFAATVNGYFPGLFRHHGLWIYGAFQQRKENSKLSYTYSDLIGFPRGYTGISEPRLVSLQGNYKFPLFYPDFSAGSVLYIKRFKMNVFYDWTQGWEKKQITTYASTGAELTADFHLLRFVAPIEMGVRSIWFPQTQRWGFELIYSISY